MGIRNHYKNGVFNWVDLMTTEPDAAKTFYSKLFGWTFLDQPTDMGAVYSMALKNTGDAQRSVAALFAMPEEIKQQSIPPHWQSYINVLDLDASIQRWQQNGGSIINAPRDVMTSGRMAMVQDPTGAIVSLWQAKDHIGAELVNEVNTFCWAELQTRGSDTAGDFYKAVFDWEIEVDDKPPYYLIGKVSGKQNCGIFDMDRIGLPASIPVQWAVYFNVENLDTAIDIVKANGGKVMMDPMVIDPGRFTTITDPQGAVLAIMEVNDPDD
ncbi:MAG: VOC family protein [Cyanobacteria bacterium P01_F01_bin.150]